MAGMDDIYTAMNMFSTGMQRLAVNQGINDATQQVSALNAAYEGQQDELAKRNQQTQIANGLALRLTAAGASPQQISQATSAVAPPTIASGGDMYTQGVLKNDPNMIKTGIAMQKQEASAGQALQDTKNKGEANVANIKGQYGLEEAKLKGVKAQSEMQFKFSKAFDSATKPLVDGLDTIDTMQSLSKLGGNPTADMAIRSNLARTIGSEKGRIAVQEISQYTGSQDLANRFTRLIQQAASGKVMTDKDRALVDETIQTAKVAKEAALKEKIGQHSERAALENAFPDAQSAIKAFVGGSQRLQQIAGIAQPQAAAAASAPSLPAGAPQGAVRTEMRTSSKTGQPVKVYVNQQGMAIGRAE